MNGEEPPFKRRKIMKMKFMMLTDDLILNCLARVPRLYHPSLNLVSNTFRFLLSSTEFYKTRSFLNRTESCLYVCLRLSIDSNTPNWFAISGRRRPNTCTKYGLVPISSPSSPFGYMSGVASVGYNIYVIGGSINNNASCSVLVMDCRFHIWLEGPSMRVARLCPSVCVLDEKIYVTGGSENLDSTNWMEIFDTKTQTWEFLQIPSEEICHGSKYKTAGYEGTIYVNSENTYKLHKGRWRKADYFLQSQWEFSSSHCVIENVLYRSLHSRIAWYNSNEKLWRSLEGLSWPISPRPKNFVKLVDYGGNLVAFWETDMILNDHKKKLIWCAEIALERDRNGKMRGTLKWWDIVFITDEQNGLVHALATTL